MSPKSPRTESLVMPASSARSSRIFLRTLGGTADLANLYADFASFFIMHSSPLAAASGVNQSDILVGGDKRGRLADISGPLAPGAARQPVDDHASHRSKDAQRHARQPDLGAQNDDFTYDRTSHLARPRARSD